MAFNSVHFLLFLPTVLLVAWSLRRQAGLRIGFLLVASYYFYMSWNALYAGLILGSTLLDYFAGLGMVKWQGKTVRRSLLVLSLAGNLGVLLLFKYHNFFVDSIASAFGLVSAQLHWSHHNLLLPVGISFYTFQTLSYTIDVYRGELKPTRNFFKFALFVSFFPQLVAGPIVRASHFLPQLDRPARYSDRRSEEGLAQILTGLVKKVCIADVIGLTLIDPVYADPSAFGSWTLTMAFYGYALQIYYDFSGYSDIAIGAARMLGYDLPVNFNRPYLATSIRDFWRRWHISLSTWFRDYIYVPMGGSRAGVRCTIRNLIIVTLLSGLWHGAAMTFVLWGAMHGLLLGLERLWRHWTGVDPDRADQPAAERLARVVVTFHLAAFCFVLFRAASFETFAAFLRSLVAWKPDAAPVSILAYAAMLAGFAWEWLPRGWFQSVFNTYLRAPSPVQACVVSGVLLLLAIVGQQGAPFIYFQF